MWSYVLTAVGGVVVGAVIQGMAIAAARATREPALNHPGFTCAEIAAFMRKLQEQLAHANEELALVVLKLGKSGDEKTGESGSGDLD